jgi:redox-sensitive bicupin YhaK (pirin superfamily)|tara:strand:+ start:1461 stop:1853 length:393 start_codon:yes stop_codon:yes gene_type:complete
VGTAFAAASPVKTFADTLYIEAWLKPGQKLTLPDAEERGLYVAKGKLRAGGTEVPEYSMAVLAAHEGVTVEAIEDTRIALVGGEPLGRRFIEWNFVSSRKECIEQAKDDWQNRRFPTVPGDEEDFIPLSG